MHGPKPTSPSCWSSSRAIVYAPDRGNGRRRNCGRRHASRVVVVVAGGGGGGACSSRSPSPLHIPIAPKLLTAEFVQTISGSRIGRTIR